MSIDDLLAMSASCGGHGSQGTTDPKLSAVTPSQGKTYIEAAKKLCLKCFPSVVSLFNNGIMPVEMLEFPPPYDKLTLLARKAGCYFDAQMQPVRVNQTLVNYRNELIAKTRTEFKCTGAQAKERIWPESGKKTREYYRATVVGESQNLTQCLLQLYP